MYLVLVFFPSCFGLVSVFILEILVLCPKPNLREENEEDRMVTIKSILVVHAYSPSSWEVEAGLSETVYKQVN